MGAEVVLVGIFRQIAWLLVLEEVNSFDNFTMGALDNLTAEGLR